MCKPTYKKIDDPAGAIVNSIKNQTNAINTQFDSIKSRLDGIQSTVDKQTSAFDRQTDVIKGVKSSIENLSSEIKQQINPINTQLGGIQNKMDKQISTLDKQTKSICNEIEALRKEIDKKLNVFVELKPHWSSYVIPIIMVLLFVAILLLPLPCSSQTTCCCCSKDTVAIKQPVTIQFDIDILKLLEEVRYDSSVMKQDIIISPETITIQQHSKLWPVVVFRITCAIILLLALIFTLKYLVPYWTKIAELKDKEKERQMKYDEEQKEYERLQKRTDISIQDREARAAIDEKAKDADHNRRIEIIRQEYQAHLADIALEMVKVANSSKDQETINQIIQQLIKQNNEQQ